jgi:hypothetical protein
VEIKHPKTRKRRRRNAAEQPRDHDVAFDNGFFDDHNVDGFDDDMDGSVPRYSGRFVSVIQLEMLPKSSRTLTFEASSDYRPWSSRGERSEQRWKAYLQKNTDAFLDWKCGEQLSKETAPSFVVKVTVDFVDGKTLLIVLQSYRLSYSSMDHIGIEYNRTFSLCMPTKGSSLLRQGFMGSSPMHPSAAFSLRTLDWFSALQLHQSSFSAYGFIQTICDTSNVSSLRYSHLFKVPTCLLCSTRSLSPSISITGLEMLFTHIDRFTRRKVSAWMYLHLSESVGRIAGHALRM